MEMDLDLSSQKYFNQEFRKQKKIFPTKYISLKYNFLISLETVVNVSQLIEYRCRYCSVSHYSLIGSIGQITVKLSLIILDSHNRLRNIRKCCLTFILKSLPILFDLQSTSKLISRGGGRSLRGYKYLQIAVQLIFITITGKLSCVKLSFKIPNKW